MKRSSTDKWSYLTIALLLQLTGQSSGQETATFISSNMAMYKLLRAPSANIPFLGTMEMKIRTSQRDMVGNLFYAKNDGSEQLSVKLNGHDKLTLMLFWNATNDHSSSQHWYMQEIAAPGISDGEWHSLSMSIESGGLLHLDGKPLAGRLPNNFTARFRYENNVMLAFGYFFRGCFANVTLDGVIQVPLSAQSMLLNQTDSLKAIALQDLPKKLGCHQAPCPCEPKGACIYKQWDLVDRCNCTRGYTPASMCRSEWDTCLNLEGGPPCLNNATCRNVPGLESFQCICASGFVGKRCQNASPCRPYNPCENGGTCIIYGDEERQDSISYMCSCASGFRGKNCTEFVPRPDLSSHDPTALIIILCVTFGSILLISLTTIGLIVVLKGRKKGTNNPVTPKYKV